MGRNFLLFFLLLLTGQSLYGQHLELMDDKGELGAYMGYVSYNGDVANDIQFVKMNYGAYYKKQLNAYIGLKLNYEKVNLEASDAVSNNAYNMARNFYFKRNFQEVSLLTELYFNRFINGRKNFRCSPYLGFGAGMLISTDVDVSSYGKYTNQYPIIPVQLGLKYSVTKHINVFTEFKYRFTTTDYLDHFTDAQLYNGYQASRSGKDQYVSALLGISYNFRAVYGPDPVKNKKYKKLDRANVTNQPTRKWGFLNPFKHK